MNETNRQKVLNYCSQYDSYPLYFQGYESNKEEFDPKKYTVHQMINRVLELSDIYPSYNSNTNEFESSYGRWRSSFDIWRHIIYYYPTVEIFEVMQNLYKYYHVAGGVMGQFCTDVERRTFKNTSYNDSDNYMSARYLDRVHNRKHDEYELDWKDWKDI